MLRILLRRALPIAVFGLLLVSLSEADPIGTTPQRIYGSYLTDIHGGPVNVVINGHDTAVVTVYATGIAPGITVGYTLAGGVLTVTATASSAYQAGTDPGTITFSMPRFEFLTVENGSGNLSITNLSTTKLEVATTAGNIEISDTNAALKASSTTGSQTYRKIFGVITAHSTGGSIKVDSEVGVLTLASQTGALSGKGIWLQGDATFATTTGPIDMTFENGLNAFHFDLTSSTGALSVGDLTRKGTLSWGGGGVRITGTSTSGSQSYE